MWTAADAAELDCLVWAFVDGFFDHRERCAVCSVSKQPWCDHATRAFDAILAWRCFRALKTRAEVLRALEEAA